MEKDPRARLKQWLSSGKARLQPLTFPQRELWETSPVDPGDPANNICSFFEIEGPLTVEEGEAAIRRVVERQEVMRTSFLPGKDRPFQIIRSAGETVLRVRELSEAESRPEALAEVMDEGFREPFDMVRGPLYRMDMLQRGEEDFVLAFTIHHAVADGWTLGAFVEDLCTAYIIEYREAGGTIGEIEGLRDSMPPVPMSYSQWGASERAHWTPERVARHAEFWNERLAGSRQLMDAAGAAKAAGGRLEKWVTSIPPKLAGAARGLARKTRSTLFNTLLAAFQIALNRWSGVEDIVVGTPVANRSKAVVRETMGYFSSVVPLRGEVDRTRPFAGHLKSVQEDTMDAFAHAMPFAELAGALGEPEAPGRHAIFDTRFALQNHRVPDVVLPGISTKLKTVSTGTTRFDLGCELTEEEAGFEVVWLHRPSVVPLADIQELDRLYREVLTAVCRRPEIQPGAMTV